MLELRRLALLHQFAVHGTITAAAQASGYSASAVSQQLAVLEREVGVALLERSARSATLTDAGRTLAEHAARILNTVEAAEADLASPGTRIAIGLDDHATERYLHGHADRIFALHKPSGT